MAKAVLPGEFISTEEEFEPGQNTFAENGSILSDSVGKVIENNRQKAVHVEKPRPVTPAKVGDIVYGKVMLMKDNSVSLSIFVDSESNERKVLSHTFASLPVRFVSREYVKDLYEMFKIGDLVKAKIASVNSYGIDVRTNEPELGVMRAFCSKCRQPLHLFGQNLKCLNCGSAERRKIPNDYSLK